MGAADYAWAIETHALDLNFCLTFVRGLGPDDVISRLGGADPVSIVTAEAALGAADAVQERVDDLGASHRSGLDYVAVTRAGDWTMIIEPNGFLCTKAAAVRALSSTGEMVAFYYNENTTPRFGWAIGGVEAVGFDPGYPRERHGSDPGRLDGLLAELGFPLEGVADEEDFDEEFQERTLALMERITGVRWGPEFLQGATFRCAGVGGVGSRVAAEPWYAEVREELAAYAEDPGEWGDHDPERWGERGVTDRRVKALGSAGTTIYDEHRDVALAIAYAPAELIERMDLWAWERPFRSAGILAAPWFAPIRDLVRRGEPVSGSDMRLVEERMDPYLESVAPAYLRADRARRSSIARALVVQWGSSGPVTDLCWQFARAAAAAAGSMSELLADLWRDFPELRDVVIPPPPPPPRERDAVRRKREARERQDEQWRQQALQRTWGGRIPADERLLEPEVQSRALGLVPYDRDLIDRIGEAGPRVQRQMAVWVARYCCTRSGMIANDWVETALIALERGDPPPPWFADFDAAFARWRNVPPESVTHSASVSFGNAEPARIDPAVIVMHVLVMARHDDPLMAAMDTVRNAVLLDDPGATLAAFRQAFALA